MRLERPRLKASSGQGCDGGFRRAPPAQSRLIAWAAYRRQRQPRRMGPDIICRSRRGGAALRQRALSRYSWTLHCHYWKPN